MSEKSNCYRRPTLYLWLASG